MSQLYPFGKQALLEGGIAYLTDTIKAALVTTAYSFSSADEFLTAINADIVGTPQALASKTSTGGLADAANVVFLSVANGSTIGFVAIYKDTGVAGTSRLIALIDRASLNGAPAATINFATNGGDIDVNWNPGGIFAL